MLRHQTDIPWRERAFLSAAEAAQIVARSPDWIRSTIAEGRLDAIRLTPAGPFVVSVSSLIALIAAAEPIAPSEIKPLPARAPQPRERVLRLVASNR